VEAPGERHYHILLPTRIDFADFFWPKRRLPTALRQRAARAARKKPERGARNCRGARGGMLQARN